MILQSIGPEFMGCKVAGFRRKDSGPANAAYDRPLNLQSIGQEFMGCKEAGFRREDSGPANAAYDSSIAGTIGEHFLTSSTSPFCEFETIKLHCDLDNPNDPFAQTREQR